MNALHRLTLALAAAATLATAAPAAAQEAAEEGYASMAVQNRRYAQRHEFDAHFGVLPLDAFTKGLTLSGSYTFHPTNLFAWEVLHGLKSFHLDTDLREELEQLSVAPTPFEVLDWMVTSNLVLKPIYWKGAFLNRSVLHGEVSLVVGGGYGRFSRSGRAVIDVGLALRLFASETFSVRLDVRHHMFLRDTPFSGGGLDHELWIALAFGLGA
ncbi:MAG TPA: outer membrane beta-barrel domain-containing protein [Polyangiaceae bacterium LLY-WYZ-15_(1-7)]|nr:outer membrane beta-barrel domain-containing protein [Myxococcales bacterium]MAT25923.1 outer membrane beta-barrel domain-containing protein [Sandaracinus sp.]HJL02272.1 outer membrane beta-barrel domain-containing protein [Polyangiaceae bacterium LLY-WYZ-15_(1-7)]HJL09302.1 outer membrane beta-barrel domain-containing protein [Polyangiaceae bacterium LLY-WYZ-15_(1-7)]HJL22861.1 outer membrane beta-barrel domain-containing protein [Polyangiaceae bacterium LLY-WYZ-15_(1-7)]